MINNYKYKIIIFSICFFIISILLNGCSAFIKPSNGSLYINSTPAGARIYLNNEFSGEITPSFISDLVPGNYNLRLTLEDSSLVYEDSIVVVSNETVSIHIEFSIPAKYRALCIGVDDYKDPGISDLRAPSYDIARMVQVLENSNFGEQDNGFTNIDTLIGKQATKENIFNAINLSFAGANEDDVSYFYFSGHGYSDGQTSTLLPHDALAKNASMDISAEQLASALSNIAGTKVVLLDSCFSGGFIGKDIFSERFFIKSMKEEEYINNILNVFILQDQAITRKNLATGSFQVLVSATGDQECWETLYHPVDGNPYGYFSAALSQGCGYNDFIFPFPADIDKDRRITIEETYQYIKNTLKYLSQDVQVYPENSKYSFIEY